MQGSDDEIYSSSAESEKKTLAVLDEHESDLYKTGSDKQPVSEERDTGKKQGCWSRFSNYVANTTLYELIRYLPNILFFLVTPWDPQRGNSTIAKHSIQLNFYVGYVCLHREFLLW